MKDTEENESEVGRKHVKLKEYVTWNKRRRYRRSVTGIKEKFAGLGTNKVEEGTSLKWREWNEVCGGGIHMVEEKEITNDSEGKEQVGHIEWKRGRHISSWRGSGMEKVDVKELKERKNDVIGK